MSDFIVWPVSERSRPNIVVYSNNRDVTRSEHLSFVEALEGMIIVIVPRSERTIGAWPSQDVGRFSEKCIFFRESV